nr:type II toxin-antitoxin system HicA family toxin [Bacilli bacterium]
MPELPNVSGKDALKTFLLAGWTVKRIHGSHHIVHKPGHDPFPIPVHGNKDLKPGTLRSMLKSAGMTVDEFTNLLKQL